MSRDATPGKGSVPGEGTVGERLVERVSITHMLLDDDEKLRAEIATLREAIRRLADQDATLSVQGGSVIVTMDATITDEEREAIEMAASACDVEASLNAAREGRQSFAGIWSDRADTFRKLLERLK